MAKRGLPSLQCPKGCSEWRSVMKGQGCPEQIPLSPLVLQSQSTGIVPGTGTAQCRESRALFAVLFKGQIPEQQLHPWSPGMPQPPDSWVPSAVTTHINLPLTVTTGDKAHETDSDSFLPLFPLWFSFTATAVCLRWPGMKKPLLSWWNMWDQVRPWLCRELNKWPRAACAPTDRAQLNTILSSPSFTRHTHKHSLYPTLNSHLANKLFNYSIPQGRQWSFQMQLPARLSHTRNGLIG